MATVTDLNTTVRCRHCRTNAQIETYHDEAQRQTCYRVYHPHRTLHQADSMDYVFTLPDYHLSHLNPKALMAAVQERIDLAMADLETRCRAAEQHATPPPQEPTGEMTRRIIR